MKDASASPVNYSSISPQSKKNPLITNKGSISSKSGPAKARAPKKYLHEDIIPIEHENNLKTLRYDKPVCLDPLIRTRISN